MLERMGAKRKRFGPRARGKRITERHNVIEFRAAPKNTKPTAIWRREGGARSAAGNETAAQGQIFLGFTPILNDFGSALVNSYTAGWNLPHSPYLSHSIGPLMPSKVVPKTASRRAFLPM